MLQVIAGCVALMPTGDALLATPIEERSALRRAETVACVQHYEAKLLAGERLRIVPGMPRRDRGGITTAHLNTWMRRRDVNGSGGIDADEWLEKQWEYELLYDLNDDGRISREEYLAGRVVGDPASPDPDRRTLHAMSSQADRERFARLSRRGQPLTRNSLAHEAAQTFRAHDLDRDGEVTPADMARVARGELRR